jgi:tetratricopeptide (TPR) repeat protein
LASVLLNRGAFAASERLCTDLLSDLPSVDVPLWPYKGKTGVQRCQALMYRYLGLISWSLGHYEEAERHMEQSVALFEETGDQTSTGGSLHHFSRILSTLGAYERAEELAQQTRSIAATFGNRLGSGLALGALGVAACGAGRYAEADARCRQALAFGRESGLLELEMEALNVLGATALALGRVPEARRHFEESLAALRRRGAAYHCEVMPALVGLGRVACAEGKMVQAEDCFRQVLAAAGCPAFDKMDAIAGMAQVRALEGDAVRAAELLVLVAHHPFTAHATRERVRALLAEFEAELPAGVFTAATARGRARELDEMVAELVGGPTDSPSAETPCI